MTSSKSAAELAADLNAILARIEAARKAAQAPAPQTSLIAVSKGHGVDEIAAGVDSYREHFDAHVLSAAHQVLDEQRARAGAFSDAELDWIAQAVR